MRALSVLLLSACAGPVPATAVWFEDRSGGVALDRASAELSIEERLAAGVCVLDADGVPPLDLFFPGLDGARLFVARGAWTYDEVELGAAAIARTIGCLALDADGDADDDLFATGPGTLALLENDGGRFVDRPELVPRVPPSHLYTSATAADYDGDGDLDVAVGGFVDLDRSGEGMCGAIPCALDLRNAVPVPSLLLRRTARGYEDATAELAPELAIAEPTLVVGSPDVDDDGRPDLYRGNDFGARFHDRILVRGADGVLRDAAARHGLAYDSGGGGIDTMGWTTGDVDGDGRFDHAVTAFEGMHSPIFVCGEDGFCEDDGRARGTTATRDTFRWGNALADLDRDGDLDLLEAAGHLYHPDEGRAIGVEIANAQPPNLLVNRGDGRFDLCAPLTSDALSIARPARGIAVADLDDDGRLDVVLATTRGGPGLLANVMPGGHFLRVVLRGRAPNTGGVGALVTVIDGAGVARVRRRLAGEGFLGSFDPRLHFGLPGVERVRVQVRWPRGASSSIETDVDREITIEEP